MEHGAEKSTALNTSKDINNILCVFLYKMVSECLLAFLGIDSTEKCNIIILFLSSVYTDLLHILHIRKRVSSGFNILNSFRTVNPWLPI